MSPIPPFGSPPGYPKIGGTTAVIGAELLSSPGNFNNSADWTLPGPEWVGTATTLTATAASSTVTYVGGFTSPIVAGTVYRIAFRTTSVTAGSFTFNLGGATSLGISTNSGFGALITVVSTTTAGLTIVGTGFTGVIQSLSIRAITPAKSVLNLLDSSGVLQAELRVAGTNTLGFGLRALIANQAANNVGFGANAGRSILGGHDNTGIGANVLQYAGASTCSNNLALGSGALGNLYGGNNNVAIGSSALPAQQVGNANTAIGVSAGQALVSGPSNLLIGYSAGVAITTGASNVCLGASTGTNLTTGSSNTLLGAGINAPSGATSNYLSIGDVIKGDTSLKIVGVNIAASGNGYLQVQAGSSATAAKVGGVLFDHVADAGNATTVETDLYSDSIVGSTLINNGDKLQAQYGGTFVSSATATREVRLYFGGTAIFDTGALTLSLSSSWALDVLIMRKDAATVRYKIDLTTEGAALGAYTAVGELSGLTLAIANILKITGQAAGTGAATNDIVAKIGTVEWKSAA